MNSVQLSSTHILFLERVDNLVSLMDRAIDSLAGENPLSEEQVEQLNRSTYAFQMDDCYTLLMYTTMLRSFAEQVRNGASAIDAVDSADVPWVNHYDRAYYCYRVGHGHLPMVMNDLCSANMTYQTMSFEELLDCAARHMLKNTLSHLGSLHFGRWSVWRDL